MAPATTELLTPVTEIQELQLIIEADGGLITVTSVHIGENEVTMETDEGVRQYSINDMVEAY